MPRNFAAEKAKLKDAIECLYEEVEVFEIRPEYYGEDMEDFSELLDKIQTLCRDADNLIAEEKAYLEAQKLQHN